MFSDKEHFKAAFVERLETIHGKSVSESTAADEYITLGNMIRDHLTRNWIATNNRYRESGEKQAYYFSMEFLLGRLLDNNLINLGIRDICKEGLSELGVDLEVLISEEPDAGLGNGGLGRLAACFLDSLASLSLPGHGCGIRYKYGLFEQKIVEGHQVELPEYWLREGNVWEFRKFDKAVEVRFGGTVRVENTGKKLVFHHENYEPVLAVPYDIPITGYLNKTVNTLRLWSAEPDPTCDAFLTSGLESQQKALEYKYSIESISQFLYPDDTNFEGRVLRLKQEYFLVSAGLQSIIRAYKRRKSSLHDLHNKIAFHINDTHPALAVPELMRILMDVEGFSWEKAFKITTQAISYTNHTTLAEALETWPEEIFKELLPRIHMIVVELNERFCRELWKQYPGDWDRIHKMAIVADGRLKMSHLAIVGSHSVNGVAKIHTKILKKREMNLFYQYFPQKFNNKTNGITHRRWLLKANPLLAELISDVIGKGWTRHPDDLIALERYSRDASFQEKLFRAKQANKEKLARYIKEHNGIAVDVESIFDIQVKRIHAYKRQVLNALHIMHLYYRLKENPDMDFFPRTFIFSGKAAPGYHQAKRTIKLITSLAEQVNSDPQVNQLIKVVFLENYRVSLAELIIPAADLSEQISTASKEASGTGNMKFMMNGAVTIGTMDGANIEIFEEVDSENMFVFGLSSSEVISYYLHGGYRSYDIYEKDPRVKVLMDQLSEGFSGNSRGDFQTIHDCLLAHNDEYFILKDFASYVEAQEEASQAYSNRSRWCEMTAVNIAHSGKFSSDRTISQYASGIWEIEPLIIS